VVQEDTRPSRRGLIALAVVLAAVLVFVAIRGGVFLSRISSSGLGGLGSLFGMSAVQHKLDSGQRVNILLLGYGGPNHDGPYLTDSIMVVSFDPVTHQTAYISIPRDTEVTIHAFSDPQRSATLKINAAFAIAMQPQDFGGGLASRYQSSDPRDGAFRLADDVVGALTGLHIDYNIGADFGGFDKVVDDVGGVDLYVPESFSIDVPAGKNGWITQYFAQGWQHMNGGTALRYVRGRYTACSETHWWSYRNGQRLCGGHPFTDADAREASDFARAQRQQSFLEAFRQRAVKLDAISHLGDIASSLESEVRTDLSLPGDAQALWNAQKQLRQNGVLHVSLNSDNLLYACTCDANGYTLHPYGSGSVLHRFLQQVFEAPAVKENVQIKILDGSGAGGDLSSMWKDLLTQMGFTKVTDGGAAARSATTHVADGTGGKAKHTLGFLTEFFSAQPATSAPAGQVELVLGHDAYTDFFSGGQNAQASTQSAAPRGTTSRPAGPSPSPAGGGGGGGGGGGPTPLPLPSILPPSPFRTSA
jgi:polyisoprenyl-teichoic acid--peptidoglycan teichoic acid transferase